MNTIDTVLPETLRKQHAQNLELGCGNFLHQACALSPNRAQTHLWMDRPYKLFTGEIYPSFSLKELCHVVDTLAAWYYGVGVRSKDPIAVYVDEGVGNLIHYLALNAIGAIPTIVNGNVPAAIAAGWIKKVGSVGLYSDTNHAVLIAQHVRSNDSLKFFVTDESAGQVFRPQLPSIYPFRHVPNDTVLVGHSSGTTGIPKAVEFKHQQFFYGIRYRLGLPFPKGSERILSALPHSHSAGIAYLMLAILNGSSTLVMSTNRPESVLPCIDQFQPTMVVAFPETYVLLGENDLESHDLSSIQLWFNGGDAAHETHIRRLVAKGHSNVDGKKVAGSVFIDGLGSSEMGFSLFRNVHTLSTENYNRCIGTPLDFVDAAVLGEDGQKLLPFQVGRLGVKSPTVTAGYWNDSVLTARSQVDGYFLTGDLFYRDEANRFFHVDRVPDAIRTRLGMVYSLGTEEFLMKHFSEIADCTVVAAPSEDGFQVAIAIVRLRKAVTRRAEELVEAFNEQLKAANKTQLQTVVLGDSDAFPTGPTGKILKRELREFYRDFFERKQPHLMEPLHA